MPNNNRMTYTLEGALSTNASSTTYAQALDSYLYNGKGVSRPPDRVKFFIQTVDSTGKVLTYTINGYTLIGLVLLINPTTASVNLSKMVNRTQTMTAWWEDHWGEELDTITFAGSSAGFLWEGPVPIVAPNTSSSTFQTTDQAQDVYDQYNQIPDMGIVDPHGVGDVSGLTVRRRRDTVAYDEFRKIIQLMNANGATFDLHGRVNNRAYIELRYDYAAYRGYFESFDITENAESPFKFNYITTFKSEKTIYSFIR